MHSSHNNRLWNICFARLTLIHKLLTPDKSVYYYTNFLGTYKMLLDKFLQYNIVEKETGLVPYYVCINIIKYNIN